jgi:penicillin G amidase
VRYISHLNAPGFNVIGAGWPGSPGEQNGHNDRIAFGRTNWSNDSEDVYILRTDPEHPDCYFYPRSLGSFFRRNSGDFRKGCRSRTPALKYSKLGPIVAEHPAEGRAIAIRAACLEPGASTALTILRYNFAHDWHFFREALSGIYYGTNYLYADVEGNIGWQVAGAVPIRPNHDGLMPVPAEQRYEWKGFWTLDELPGVLNPPEGWIASANEMNLPRDFPYPERKIGFEWPPADRHERIVEVLNAGAALRMEDSVALQHDVLAKRAPQLLSAICSVRTDDTRVIRAISILESWNLRMDADSVGAAIFAIARTMIHRAIRELVTPKELDELIPFVHPVVVRDVLESADSRFVSGSLFDRDILIEGAVRRALDALEKRLGADWSAWSWGRLNTAHLKHPLARILTQDQRSALNIEGGGSGRSTDTVMARYTIGKGGVINHGASYSMVLDVGEWDNSLAMNSPGQSGDAASSHYRDLHSRWLSGEMFPLLFGRGEIERVAETRVWLQSAPANSER